MTTARFWARLGGLAAALTLAVGLTASPAPAQARTDVSIGLGIGIPVGGYYGRPYRDWDRPYWGGRPYWGPRAYYGRPYYRPYRYSGFYSPYRWQRPYWGPRYGFVATFPLATVDRWREPVRVYHSDAYMSALDGRLGETYRWEDGDDEGEVTAVRDGYSGDKYCREFRQQVTIGGERQEAYGAACQQPDGSWQIVPHNP